MDRIINDAELAALHKTERSGDLRTIDGLLFEIRRMSGDDANFAEFEKGIIALAAIQGAQNVKGLEDALHFLRDQSADRVEFDDKMEALSGKLWESQLAYRQTKQELQDLIATTFELPTHSAPHLVLPMDLELRDDIVDFLDTLQHEGNGLTKEQLAGRALWLHGRVNKHALLGVKVVDVGEPEVYEMPRV